MSSILRRLVEAFTRRARSGYAYPRGKTIFETPTIPLEDCVKLYLRDPTVKASVDLLASATAGIGFYTTADPKFKRYEQAKEIVDDFNAEVGLDQLLLEGVKMLVACGNDFWLKLTPQRLEDFIRLPPGCIRNIERETLDADGLKIPHKITGYTLDHKHGGKTLRPEAIIHFKINAVEGSAFGTGIVQVLLHRLTLYGETRPAYAEIKAEIERVMPKIFEKYAGPDVLALLEEAKEEDIKKFERVIKNRPPEGAWLFYSGKGDVKPVRLDPRARFEFYVDHIINQVYLGCETPLPRLFSTPGFTEASAKTALEMQEWLINPLKRYVKRMVEREIFNPVLLQAGFEPRKAHVRLNWGSPEVPEVVMADMLRAAELGLIRPEEFRKNAAKFGWELWEQESETQA